MKRAIRNRLNEMRTDPVYRPALARMVFLSAIIGARSRFITERRYLLCRQYIIERSLPRFIEQTDEPFDDAVCNGLARIVIEGFLAVDRRAST